MSREARCINIMCLETKAARKYYLQEMKQARRANALVCFTMTLCDSDLLPIVLNHKNGSVQAAGRLAQTCKKFHQATIDSHLDVALSGQTGLAYFAQTAPLAHCWRIVVLDLSGCEDVADASALASLDGLEKLNLGGTSVADLSALASMRGLKELSLESTRVVGVSALASLVGLKQLDLSFTDVVDLSALASMKGLKELNLSDTFVDDMVTYDIDAN